MLFNSYVFIFAFLPAVLSVYYLLVRSHREGALIWLVAASLFFYGWWEIRYLGLIALSILFNYSVGMLLAKRQRLGQKNLAILSAGVAVNLAALLYFKYFDFFLVNFGDALGSEWQAVNIILPLAISFFTFQQIAFLVDAHRGAAQEYKFLHYCLFVTFFPQLIAGPIVHHKEMLPQFVKKTMHSQALRDISLGSAIFFVGLFKKTIIADGVAQYSDAAFGAAASGVTLTFFEAWGGSLAYTFQLYFDFSAYSDMAVGLACMFGIRLPVNFFSPYKANSIIEFWRLWHITLSRFLRDHLYIPLGGNQRGKTRRYINILTTMVLGGLWHGAGWTFLVWGTLHGVYLVINHGWRRLITPLGPNLPRRTTYRIAARLITFLAVVIAWVYFRAENVTTANNVLHAMAGLDGISLPKQFAGTMADLSAALPSWGFVFDGMFANGLAKWLPMGPIYLLLLLGSVWLLPNTYEIFTQYDPAMYQEKYARPRKKSGIRLEWQPNVIWALILGITATLAILGLSRASEFIYFQF